jgi:hypothetical protein
MTVVEWLTFVLNILEISGSEISPQPDEILSWFYIF